MYAVVRTGGKQYRVGAGDIIEVEKLDGDVGEEITLEDILLVSNGERIVIGQPLVEGASVNAVITGQYRGPKVLSFRYRPKKRIRVRRGHRQHITRLEVKSVGLNGESFSDTMELGPVATNQTLPKKRKKSKGVAGVAAAAAATAVIDEVVDDVEDAGIENTVEEVVADVTENVSDTATDAVDAATDAVEEAADTVDSAVDEAAESAADATSDAADATTDSADSTN